MALDGGRVQAAGPLSGEDIFLVYNVEQRDWNSPCKIVRVKCQICVNRDNIILKITYGKF